MYFHGFQVWGGLILACLRDIWEALLASRGEEKMYEKEVKEEEEEKMCERRRRNWCSGTSGEAWPQGWWCL